MLAQGQLSDSANPIVINDPNKNLIIRSIVFFNVSEDFTNIVKLYVVPNDSGSLGVVEDKHQMLQITVNGEEIFDFTPSNPIVYENENDAIFIKATNANQVNYFVKGNKG